MIKIMVSEEYKHNTSLLHLCLTGLDSGLRSKRALYSVGFRVCSPALVIELERSNAQQEQKERVEADKKK